MADRTTTGTATDKPGAHGRKTTTSRPILLLLWDAGVPLAAYYGLRALGQSEQVSLLAGAALAVLRMIWVAARKHSFDGFAALLATILAVGVVLSLVSGGSRFLLVKESFGTGAAALVLLASCASKNPLVLVAVRTGAKQAKRDEIDRLREEAPPFERAFVLMTAVWGVGLLLESILRVPLVYLLPADLMAALSLVLLLVVIGALSMWTVWYAGRVEAHHRSSGESVSTAH